METIRYYPERFKPLSPVRAAVSESIKSDRWLIAHAIIIFVSTIFKNLIRARVETERIRDLESARKTRV